MGKNELQDVDRFAAAPVRPNSPAIRVLIAAIADEAGARDRGEADASGAIALIRAAKLGILRVPERDGGGGATLTQLFEIVIALGAADPNIPHILRNHFAFVEKALRAKGDTPGSSGERYRRWLQVSRDGSLIGSGVSELGNARIGSLIGATQLVPDGDGYLLSGRKYYSTGNLHADYLLVNAQTADEKGVLAFLPRGQPGVQVIDDWDGIGQRLSASGTTVFENARVASDDIVFPNDETDRPHYQATFPQLYLTAIIAGILRSVVTDAVALVKGRERNYYHAVADRPADDPLLQQTVGQIASNAYIAEAAVLRAADALGAAFQTAINGLPDQGLFAEAALRAARAKVAVDELAQRTAAQLFDVGGASAAKQSARLDRHWRNIRTLASHNPVSYKARAIGDHLINDVPLPRVSFF